MRFVRRVIPFTRASRKSLKVRVKSINSVSVTNVNVLPSLIRLLAFLFILSFSATVQAERASCLLKQPMHQVSVHHINDGDTLTLADGNRVRIIGINTPELAYKDKPGQPLAVEARDRLSSYLQSGHALIVYDEESHDKYGRILAHVFDEQGNNVGEALIREGLAFAVSIPPSLRYRQCYRDAERHARHAELGVWSNPYFNPIAAHKLKYSGFQRVQGCIQRTRKYRDKIYLYLADNFRLSVAAESARYFEPSPIVFEKGLCLVATGWVYNQSSYRNMKLLHPDAVQVVR